METADLGVETGIWPPWLARPAAGAAPGKWPLATIVALAKCGQNTKKNTTKTRVYWVTPAPFPPGTKGWQCGATVCPDQRTLINVGAPGSGGGGGGG